MPRALTSQRQSDPLCLTEQFLKEREKRMKIIYLHIPKYHHSLLMTQQKEVLNSWFRCEGIWTYTYYQALRWLWLSQNRLVIRLLSDLLDPNFYWLIKKFIHQIQLKQEVSYTSAAGGSLLPHVSPIFLGGGKAEKHLEASSKGATTGAVLKDSGACLRKRQPWPQGWAYLGNRLCRVNNKLKSGFPRWSQGESSLWASLQCARLKRHFYYLAPLRKETQQKGND